MSTPETIGVFYSPGQNFPNVLKNIRKRHPMARIEAVVPKNYPETNLLSPACDAIIETDFEGYPISKPRRLPQLVRQLRSRRYDRFVVLFDSLKQRWLCAVCGASHAECWSIYGRVAPLATSVPSFLAAAVGRGFGGKLTYLRVLFIVYAIPARVTKPDK